MWVQIASMSPESQVQTAGGKHIQQHMRLKNRITNARACRLYTHPPGMATVVWWIFCYLLISRYSMPVFFFVSSVYPSLCYVLWLLQINKMNIILTHNRHLAIRQLWHWAANRYLQRGDIECSHIVFTATFIIIVDNILSYIIIRTRIFDMRLTSPIVYNKHKYQNCLCVVLIYTSFIWI